MFGFEGREPRRAGAGRDARPRTATGARYQAQTDLVLTPAACYPVYPAIAARGPLPPGGVTVDAGGSYVFRNEPSGDPARLQMFHQREMVRIGEPDTVAAWRDTWRDRALDLLRDLGLDAEFDVASDPFFGRSGRMLAVSQREQALKFEVHRADRLPRSDRRRVLQLPPGALRRGPRASRRPTGRSRTRRAWASGSSG